MSRLAGGASPSPGTQRPLLGSVASRCSVAMETETPATRRADDK